MTNCKYVMRIA